MLEAMSTSRHLPFAAALALTVVAASAVALAEDVPRSEHPSPGPPPAAAPPADGSSGSLPVPEEEMYPPWERGNQRGADRGEKPSEDEPRDGPEIRSGILKGLYEHLAKAKDAESAAAIAAQIERLWFVSGSDTIDLLMQRALAAMGEQNLDLALSLLTAVTELQPDYAEGWNRRALIYFKMSDVERALGDLRRALALEPGHYKALEGVASVLREAGSKKQALEALRKLTEMHPFLPGVKEAIEELTREVEGQGI
jgi:tetratricopeptide (TPR) repeat protein